MLMLKRIYEPLAPEDGVRILVERRWPPRLDKQSAAIDRWEKQVAPSPELHRWFGGRRARWAEFRTRYLLELSRHREEPAEASLFLLCRHRWQRSRLYDGLLFT